MTADVVNSYFTPLYYFFYLGTLFTMMVVYYQWKWTRTCQENVLVLVVLSDGHGAYFLTRQVGGSITLINKHTKSSRLWPINELATIDVPFPGVGFVPAFLQKSIRQVIVDEKDWEPMLNRSPHRPMVMSPDMVISVKDIAEDIKDEEVKAELLELVNGVSTGPTRELIASPAFLHNLINERVSEVAITVVKDVLDPIAAVIKRLNQLVSPTMFYIGTGSILLGIGIIVYLVMPLVDRIDLIIQSLGITVVP